MTAPSPIPPGSVLGIIGGGQLGRMTALAAAMLGYRVHVFTPETNAPASHVAWRTTVADYADHAALRAFAEAVDVITFEFENIPPESLEVLERARPVFPGVEALRVSRNRVREKTFVNGLGIETAPFRVVTDVESLREAVKALGLPAILKTSEMGYDGKGQIRLDVSSSLEEAWHSLHTGEAVLEGFVDFTMEISVIVARGADGETAVYPPVQNIHKRHILDVTVAPAPIDAALSAQALETALAIAVALDVRGLLAVEMFVTKDNRLWVNEIAPRPHNSGHFSMDACKTGQFEQLVRAVAGLPLGSVDMFCPARMKNLVGDEVEGAFLYLANKNAKLHLYGKSETRPGRKMGHVNILEE